MRLKLLTASALLAAVIPAPGLADGLEPGSLLVFPFHRSRFTGGGTFFTAVAVTNTNLTPISPINQLGGSTSVHYEYVNVVPNPVNQHLPLDCSIADRVEFLTPADTRVVLTNCDNGVAEAEGYLVVTALDPNLFLEPWSHNHLVGSELVIGGNLGLWYLNAIPFKSPKAAQAPTDMDLDGQRDFDGIEYEGIPDELILDSFVAALDSSLVLINLSGGNAFTANVRFDVFNDNEKALSATLAFRCWTEARLIEISQVFHPLFLELNTVNDPTELDIDCDNDDDLETGWARIRGLNHSSSVESCPDAALLGALQAGPIIKLGARRLWESKAKQFDGDFLKTGTDDPECGVPPPENVPPVCDAGPAQSGLVGESIQFDGSGSSDPDGGSLTFNWSFGDGTTANNAGPMPAHVYNSAGDFVVTLTVIDGAGRSTSCTTAADIQEGNQLPVCDAGPAASGLVNTSVSFDGSGSFDPDGSALEFDWNFGDGVTVNNAGPTPSHTYTSSGDFTVTLTVTDAANRSVNCTTQASIFPGQVPTCNITVNVPTGPGGGTATPILFEQVTFTANAVDPDGGAIVSFEWDFGDGTTATGPVVMHAFNQEILFVVTLTVTDNEGDMSTCTINVLPNG